MYHFLKSGRAFQAEGPTQQNARPLYVDSLTRRTKQLMTEDRNVLIMSVLSLNYIANEWITAAAASSRNWLSDGLGFVRGTHTAWHQCTESSRVSHSVAQNNTNSNSPLHTNGNGTLLTLTSVSSHRQSDDVINITQIKEITRYHLTDPSVLTLKNQL